MSPICGCVALCPTRSGAAYTGVSYNPITPGYLRLNRMLTPDYTTFLQLGHDATLVPVARTLSADLLTPVGAFLNAAGGRWRALVLESAEDGRPHCGLRVRCGAVSNRHYYPNNRHFARAGLDYRQRSFRWDRLLNRM